MATTLIDTFVTEFVFRNDTSKLRALDKRLDNIKSKLNVVANTSIALGGAFSAGAYKTVGAFRSYEVGLNKIIGLVGILPSKLEEWKPQIEAISKETGKGPAELANALYFVTSAGLRGKDAMDVLRQSAKASAAGLGDQVAIVDLVTSAINAYGSENLTATQAVDTLMVAVREGKLAPETMAQSMGAALPIASQMGVTFAEVSGIMASLSKTGTDAAMGVTQIRAIMNQLLNPSAGARKELEKFGFTVKGIHQQIEKEGLMTTLEGISEAFDGDAERISKVFGNVRALSGVFDLLGKNKGAALEVLESVRNAEKANEKAFVVASETLDMTIKKAIAQFQFLQINIGSKMKESATSFVHLAQSLMTWVDGLDEFGKSAIAKTLTLGPALFLIGGALRVITFIMAPMARGFLWMIGLAKKWRIYAWASTVATKAWAIATKFLTRAMLLSPIGLLLTAIALLTALTVDWGWVLKKVFGGFFTVIKSIFKMFGWLFGLVGRLRNALRDMLPDWLKRFFTGTGKTKAADPSAPSFIEPNDNQLPGFDLPTANIGAGNAVAQHFGGNKKTVNVKVGDINVANGDSEEIARNLGGAIENQIQDIVDFNDNGIAA